MTKECRFSEHSNQMLDQLNQGVFLTSAAHGQINTMVIGWGGVNIVWGRPMMIVLVRVVRATHELIEASGEFTVSIPGPNDLSKALAFCGTKSMREGIDKFAVCHLTPIPGRKVAVPIIGECRTHYECKVLYRQNLDQNHIPAAIKNRYYNPINVSFANHTVYFAEIVDSYTTDDGA